jgi:hypothetical protein
VTRKLLLLLMVATAFDWLENVAALSTIVLYPTEVSWLPPLLVVAKKGKLATLMVSNGILVVSICALVVTALIAAWHRVMRRSGS